ncbi:hypothetical protein EOS_13125 [Caballeronia mineralivorans PML1(12)]|uniref:Uncharacterized protein n=1 Tax=Caballeronia mineralivorans PML1(12) TaxID=908627 RepID=A0A0J1CZ37_9BURK|nr:hypothetical protein [Caballeronia mineralivorans]KLU25817.1 hypothetical protein EOS_13125 [Caballeronia mineralivorans PML1(12)]
MDQDAPDYAEACELALSKLADLQGMKLADLIQLAAISRDDSMYYRVTSCGSVDDGLPLSFAASLLLGAEQVLLASACTVLRPQTHHPRLHRGKPRSLQAMRGSGIPSEAASWSACRVPSTLWKRLPHSPI